MRKTYIKIENSNEIILLEVRSLLGINILGNIRSIKNKMNQVQLDYQLQREQIDEMLAKVPIILQPSLALNFRQPIKNAENIKTGLIYITIKDWSRAKMHVKHRNALKNFEKYHGASISYEIKKSPIRGNSTREDRLLERYKIEYEEVLIFNIHHYCIYVIGIRDKVAYYLYSKMYRQGVQGLGQYSITKIIEEYCMQNSVEYLNLVGYRIIEPISEKLENIQRFKLRFGAEITEGYTFRAYRNHLFGKLHKIAQVLKIAPKDLITQYDEYNTHN